MNIRRENGRKGKGKKKERGKKEEKHPILIQVPTILPVALVVAVVITLEKEAIPQEVEHQGIFKVALTCIHDVVILKKTKVAI